MGTGLECDVVGQARIIREQCGIDLHRGDGAETAPDAAHEFVSEEWREGARDLGLEREPPREKSFPLGDVEVHVGGCGRGRVTRVGLLGSPRQRIRGWLERAVEDGDRAPSDCHPVSVQFDADQS